MFICVVQTSRCVGVRALKVTDPGDEVVLQVEDPQLPAPPVHVFDPLDVLLVQRNLLQGEDLAVVVLGPPTDQLLCDWMGATWRSSG